MLEDAHWTLLEEAAERPHVQCRLFGNLYGRAGAVDWNGSERHRRCGELAALGLLRSAGLTGGRDLPAGQWSRWAITEAGRKALREHREGQDNKGPEGPRSWMRQP
jgi:hypothetical protein